MYQQKNLKIVFANHCQQSHFEAFRKTFFSVVRGSSFKEILLQPVTVAWKCLTFQKCFFNAILSPFANKALDYLNFDE